MRTILICFSLLCCLNFTYAKKTHSISGTVKSRYKEAIPGVSIYITKLQKGTATDKYGKFNLDNIPNGEHLLEISFIGYKTLIKKITINHTDLDVSILMDEEIEKLDEVVVSGDAERSTKLKSAITVEVVNSEFIDKNRGGSLMQSLNKIGGISSIEIGSGQSKPVIRGLGFNRVLVAEKGLKHEGQQWGADHGLEIDQFDVQNIEVLKGPSSLGFGSDAMGGVIHIKRNYFPAKNSLHGEASTSYMTNNHSLSGSVQFEKRTNHFLVGARATGIKYGDYRVPTDHVNVYDFVVPLHKNHLRNTAGQEYNFHFHTGYLGENFHSVFYISNYNAKSGFFANAHGLEPRKVDNEAYDASNSDIDKPLQEVNHLKVTNETTLKLGEHELQLLLGYQKNIRKEKGDYVNHGYMPPQYPKELDIPSDLERKFDKDFYAIKLSDKFKAKHHQLEFGLDANLQKNNIGGWGFIIPNFTQYNIGAFALDSYTLNKNLKLKAGLRYDYGHIDIEEYTDWFTSPTEGNNRGNLTRVESLKKGYHNVSGSVGLVYTKDAWTLKTNVGNSFRMPIAKELAANGVNYHYFRYERGNRDLSPERSFQWDVTAEWENNIWLIEFSPFANYFPNYIYLNPTSEFDNLYGAGNQIFNYTQSKVFRYGGELHLHKTLFDHLDLTSISEYVKSRQLSGEKKDYGLPFSPPFSTNLSAKYNFNSFNCFKKSYFSVDFRYTAKQTDIVPPEKVTDSYQLINLGMGTNLRFGRYKAQVNLQVKNLFDTKYYNHTNFYRLIDLPEQGRNFLASVKFTF
ncbi:iron complex outermembrane receptor protein [Balneicella halophila]|uniref:Iron complex outermembrane receptor protein n=1 Tax=Balneicella halophila TaxID=1537566 RepID=A0A7L4UPU9_BALHA|nr:TonB-dependent receptor [Balneicella halophila]PVX51780.1 iron complex outermembrane receptor protein [Balneicella halophila]